MTNFGRMTTFTHFARALDAIGKGYVQVVELGDPVTAPAEAAVAAGLADLMSYAARFLTNPDLVRRFAENAPENPPVRATFHGGAEGYTDYPFLDQRGGYAGVVVRFQIVPGHAKEYGVLLAQERTSHFDAPSFESRPKRS